MKNVSLIFFALMIAKIALAQGSEVQVNQDKQLTQDQSKPKMFRVVVAECDDYPIADAAIWMMQKGGVVKELVQTNEHGFAEIDVTVLQKGLLLCISKEGYTTGCLEKPLFYYPYKAHIRLARVVYE